MADDSASAMNVAKEAEFGVKVRDIIFYDRAARLLLLVSFLLSASELLRLAFSSSLVGSASSVPPAGQSVAAIGYMAIAAALFASMRSMTRLKTVLLAVVFFLVSISVVARAVGVEAGVGHWTFTRQVPAGFAGLRLTTIVTMVMLTIAVAITDRRGRRISQAVAALASVTLGVSLIATVVGLLNLRRPDDGSLAFLPSLPGAIQVFALSIALLAWRGRFGWPELLSSGTPHARLMRRAFPIVVIVPALTALLEIILEDMVSPLLLDFMAASLNIAIFATLIFWAMARISAEHGALSETTRAMASAPIALTSLSGEIQHWSRGCEELYGWPASEIVGRRKYDVLCTRDAATSLPLRRIDDVRDADRELVEQRRDGTTVNVIERVRLVEAEGRTPVMVHTMTDITARVAVEAALRESEATLSLALESHHIGTFDWDATSRKITWSPGTEQRLGLQPGKMETFAQWLALVDPADMAAIYETIQDARDRHLDHYRFQYRFNVPNGGVRMIEGSGRFNYGADGKLARVMGLNIDVTDRNAREAALLAQQEQFRSVLKTVPTAMVIIDDLGIIKAFSASAERMFGYAAEEVIGRDIEILTPDPVRHQNDSFVARYIAGGVSHVTDGSRILQARRRDGSLVPIDLWMGDMQIGDSRLFTCFCEDLTERLAAEERLTDMRNELLHVSRLSAMGELAAGLAHELNQPLAAAVYFLGAADLLLGDEANRERGQGLVRLASEQALKAGEIIRRMRKFMTKEDVEAHVEPIAGIIEDAVSLTFVGGRQFDIDLHYDLDPAAPFVLADRIQIQQVLVNLLRNAAEELRKCPADKRRITIGTRVLDAATIEFSVADTGPGLDPLIIDRLHMPFVSTKGDRGMGVGLSICRRIIETHGGTFDAADNPEGGAIFRFTLPSMNA
ncbi:PAS domain S-box protein [Sphingomonas sp. RT2P30]|uniref:PAS domain S-box protein n=1 Tax=Parasphingomonas halimpatiens TaxID=3096162 RepID=UPI002FC5C6A7